MDVANTWLHGLPTSREGRVVAKSSETFEAPKVSLWFSSKGNSKAR